MSIIKLHGTGAALVTPFNEDGSVDFASLERLVAHIASNGVEYLVAFGTTGEPVTLTSDEKKSVMSCIKSVNNGRLPIVMGCGGNNTAEIVKELQSGFYKDAAAILSVTPYYNKPAQRGIIAHYRAVAQAAPAPVLLYNVPGRSGTNLQVDTAVEIANTIPNIIGYKEASPSVEQFTYMMKNLPDGFQVISGDDSLVLPHLSLGAVGAISVTANAMPAEYSQMVHLCLAGEFAEARKIHFKLIEFTDELFAEGSPSGVKAALTILGILKNEVRLPLVTISDASYSRLQDLIGKIKSSC